MSDSELLEIIDSVEQWADGRPVTCAPELAERVDLSRQGINQRLRPLVKQGRVKKYKPGPSSAVYWTEDSEAADD
jgi:predicted transcriptional regulator